MSVQTHNLRTKAKPFGLKINRIKMEVGDFLAKTRKAAELREISKTRKTIRFFKPCRKEFRVIVSTFPTANIELEMRFAEPEFKEAGKRIFDVLINGEIFFENFDPAKESGAFQPVSKKVIVSAENGLLIKFKAKTASPILSAICVRRIY